MDNIYIDKIHTIDTQRAHRWKDRYIETYYTYVMTTPNKHSMTNM